ncbi:unnamed protein product [Diatraea saccharalis]|uniref:Mutator-like transposase domain-containing protein n=1 Tax=Diatraea saccharalis TaxID=40085 RepID=A0A9N9RAY3_9NEOP|nr:unnamed protein product [Diatraea saccharalis]
MCQETFYIENEAPGDIGINDSAVACGHYQLQEFSAALNLPIITLYTFNTSHSKLTNHWEKISLASMTAAAQKEREMAIKEGRVDKNGVPIIDVIVDGCFSKRTYKKKILNAGTTFYVIYVINLQLYRRTKNIY